MKTPQEIERYQAVLKRAIEHPCSCEQHGRGAECRMIKQVYRETIQTLEWVLGRLPSKDMAINQIEALLDYSERKGSES